MRENGRSLGCTIRLITATSMLAAAGSCGALVYFERERFGRFFNSLREDFDELLGGPSNLETQRPPTCLCPSETSTATRPARKTPRPTIVYKTQLPTETQRPPEQPTNTPHPPELTPTTSVLPTEPPTPPIATPVPTNNAIIPPATPSS